MRLAATAQVNQNSPAWRGRPSPGAGPPQWRDGGAGRACGTCPALWLVLSCHRSTPTSLRMTLTNYAPTRRVGVHHSISGVSRSCGLVSLYPRPRLARQNPPSGSTGAAALGLHRRPARPTTRVLEDVLEVAPGLVILCGRGAPVRAGSSLDGTARLLRATTSIRASWARLLPTRALRRVASSYQTSRPLESAQHSTIPSHTCAGGGSARSQPGGAALHSARRASAFARRCNCAFLSLALSVFSCALARRL